MRPFPVFATGAALVLALQACSEPSAPGTPSPAGAGTSSPVPEASTGTGTPAATAPASAPASASVKEVLAGERKVLIHIAEDDKDWTATYEGPIAIGDGTGDGALFRIRPAGKDRYLIEALRKREEGGRWCLKADAGDEPVSLGTVVCAENENTLFTIRPTGKKDDKGRPTHWIMHDKYGTVQVKNDGSALYIQEVGDGGGRGTFSFVDRGKA